MLRCGKCDIEKPEESFSRSSKRKTGRQFWCKSCQAKGSLDRYHSKLKNCPSYLEKKSDYDKIRRDKLRDRLREYDRCRSKLPHRRALHAEDTVRRRHCVKQQTPRWANKKSIMDMYTLAQKLSDLCGVEYQVDHIVPLKGKNVCGLHVENNLQLLEASLNLSKGNRHYG